MRARFSWGDNLLLRRITKHVTDQNWFAVAIDFAIVVVGVFVGIQVANWNAARAERSQAQDLLARMISEASEAQQALQAYRVAHAGILDRNTELALRLQDEVACTVVDDAFKTLLLSIGDFPPPRFSLSTATQALNTGQLSLIRTPEIRDGVQTITDEMTFLNRQWERYIRVKQRAEQDTSQSAGLVITAAREDLFDGTEDYNPSRYALLTPERLCTDTAVIAFVSTVEATHQIYVGYLSEVQTELDAYVETLQTYANGRSGESTP